MGKLISRAEALKRIIKLEKRAMEEGDNAGGLWLVRAYNQIIECKVHVCYSENSQGKTEKKDSD